MRGLRQVRAICFGAFAVFLSIVAPAQAERLVSNPDMCAFSDPMDAQEVGMTLTSSDMFEIEYLCEFSKPIALHWDEERIETRVGFCSEPGHVSPEVWAFQFSPFEPGKVTVWWQGGDEPTIFQSCK